MYASCQYTDIRQSPSGDSYTKVSQHVRVSAHWSKKKVKNQSHSNVQKKDIPDEKRRNGGGGVPRALNCNVILEPLLGTQGTFGLVTRGVPWNFKRKFRSAKLCDVLKMCAPESRAHVPTRAMEGCPGIDMLASTASSPELVRKERGRKNCIETR
jgi:hypothetical protein